MDDNNTIINCYEKFIEKHGFNSDKLKRLMYAILFKRWDVLAEELEKLDAPADLFREKISIDDDNKLTLNGLLRAYRYFLEHPRNQRYAERITKALGIASLDALPEPEGMSSFTGYIDTKELFDNRSILDLFFTFDGRCEYPVLDVVYSQTPGMNTGIQTIPARQVADHHGSLVLDEVGMGKTVSAIYAISHVLTSSENTPPAVLILCPGSKREDWQKDIMRQLGLHSTIISDKANSSKYWYWEGYSTNTPMIYIADIHSDKQWLAGLANAPLADGKKPWDIMIIDECHQYISGVPFKAENLLMLTATPVTEQLSPFSKYSNLFQYILVSKPATPDIDPIKTRRFEKTDWFVCHFKEDMFGGTIERKIEWINWQREKADDDKMYLDACWELEVEKGFLFAAHYIQDDVNLAGKYKNLFGKKCVLSGDRKLKVLVDLFHEKNNESMIIFCEHNFTADRIYSRLVDENNDEKTLIALITGQMQRINQSQRSDAELSLKRNIENGGRSILVTTYGKFGAGLSFGEFNSLVIYEFPYTSNRLEQAFGRIERAESQIHSGKSNNTLSKNFYLMYNVPRGAIAPMSLNRIMGYCVTHMDDTISAIPARNTVILNNVYFGQVGNSFKKALQKLSEIEQLTYNLTPDNAFTADRFWQRVKELCMQSDPAQNLVDQLRSALDGKSTDEVDIVLYNIVYGSVAIKNEVKTGMQYFTELYAQLLEVTAQLTTGIEMLYLTGNITCEERDKLLNSSVVNSSAPKTQNDGTTAENDTDDEDKAANNEKKKEEKKILQENSHTRLLTLFLSFKDKFSSNGEFADIETRFKLNKGSYTTDCIFFKQEIDGRNVIRYCTVEDFRKSGGNL